jgi:hypothetical protein
MLRTKRRWQAFAGGSEDNSVNIVDGIGDGFIPADDVYIGQGGELKAANRIWSQRSTPGDNSLG